MVNEQKKDWPVLLTGTIVQHPEARAVWINPRERERQYLSVLAKMAATRNNVEAVLFCENSTADLNSFNSLISVYAKQGRTFKMFKVPMPDGHAFFGKGWGEGIIIRWALENIAILSCSSGFLKITGRYHIINLKRIITIIRRGLERNPDIKFVCQSFSTAKQPKIETGFFWADSDFYRRYMLDVHEKVRDEYGIFLEHVIADRLMQLKDRFEFAILPIPLIVKGVIGVNAKEVMSRRTIFKKELKQRVLPLPDLIPFRSACKSNRTSVKE